MSISDTPEMDLMYQPAATSPDGKVKSVEVPIQYVSWDWGGNATYANGCWTGSNLANGALLGTNTDSYPEWPGLFPGTPNKQ